MNIKKKNLINSIKFKINFVSNLFRNIYKKFEILKNLYALNILLIEDFIKINRLIW